MIMMIMMKIILTQEAAHHHTSVDDHLHHLSVERLRLESGPETVRCEIAPHSLAEDQMDKLVVCR